MGKHILVVDDEPGIRQLLEEILSDEGYLVSTAENAHQARAFRRAQRPDLVLLDIWMPDSDGISLLKEWANNGQLNMPVIMMSGHGTIDTAVSATRMGAFDFLEKPVSMQKLLSTVDRAFRQGHPKSKKALGLQALSQCPLYAPLLKRLDQVAQRKAPLLLIGEVGAGVELCARFLHQPNTPYVAPETTAWLAYQPLDLASEAQHGVLFLQEAATLNKLEQKGLLLLLGKLEKFNVQFVAATSRQLAPLAQAGTFDAHLFHLLSSLVLSVPNLRQHREHIPQLAQIILAEYVDTEEVPARDFSPDALQLLRQEPWPVTLQQLYNVIRTLALTALDSTITVQEVRQTLAQFQDETPALPSALPLDLPLREARDAFERLYFEHHLEKVEGNMSRLAEKIGLERTHLYRKLKKLGVNVARKLEET